MVTGAEQDSADGICSEPLLGVSLLESLLPIGWSELEDTAAGLGGEQAEEIPEIAPGLDAVHLAAGQMGDERSVGDGVILGANEQLAGWLLRE